MRIFHGLSRKIPEYRTWIEMKARCNNPNKPEYPNYGKRGIKVCHRWQHSFPNFLKDIGRKPTPNHSIERIDNSKGYSPNNCKWATRDEQNRNNRHTRFIEYKGIKLCMLDWSKKTKIPYQTIRSRLNAGWTINDSLTFPINRKSYRRRRGEIIPYKG